VLVYVPYMHDTGRRTGVLPILLAAAAGEVEFTFSCPEPWERVILYCCICYLCTRPSC
jgi:hypothetical protein